MRNRRVRWTTFALLLTAFALTAPAQAASTSFSSSFEPADPQPAWTDTAERASGVTGPAQAGIPGNVTDTVVADAGQRRERRPRRGQGEPRRRLRGHQVARRSSRRAGSSSSSPQPVTVVALRADLGQRRARPRPARLDAAGLRRRHDLDDARHADGPGLRRALPDQDLRLRQRRRPTSTTGSTSPPTTATTSSSSPSSSSPTAQPNPPPAAEMRSIVGSGPRGGYNAKSGVGFTGLRALRYGGTHTADGRAYSYNKVFDVDVAGHARRPSSPTSSSPTSSATTWATRAPTRRSTSRFTDGTYLSDLGAIDQHGATLSPRGQGASKTLYTNQWNASARGSARSPPARRSTASSSPTTTRSGPHDFGGWIDDIKIEAARPAPAARRARRTGS